MPETETQENVDSTTESDATTTEHANIDDAPNGAELGDGGKKAIDAERDARKAAERQLRDAQKSLKEYEDRDKTELQRALERAETAEKQATAAQFAAMRTKVAADKGVPASSLTGVTEEELTASADELIAWRDQNQTQTPTPKRSSSSGLKSGATGQHNQNPDPKAKAADALRRLRQSG